ncbi:DctP family TRAP transporter solute-binding subunit [Schinkia azotoformans]|uniref:DctP family TRAP transporter solute-binding subunit n=1 Tax=Schinkia azotoformans TaxID=1454 RepID=UPI002E1A2CE6|nr:DctP family TRAP transporter solute-binding subunit [Schinkia azotoformans]MED4352834.1 DctP family TRAP transporter solute-binding subunit [Schinkia azotoformans]
MKKIRSFMLVVLSLVVLFSLVACGSSETNSKEGGEGPTADNGIQELTIKISHVVAEHTPKHQGALKMKEVIEKESGGKIKVQIYPNSSLFGDKDEYQNLVADNVQFILPDMMKLVGNDEGFNMESMPFIFEDDAQSIAFWDGEKGKGIFQRLEKDGVLGLTMWPNGGKHITNNVRPIKLPEDLKGLKLRTQGGQLLESMYAELGAGSATIPFGELYTALQQGTVDGQENTLSNIESKKFDEVQKYMTIMNHTRVDYALLTNTKFWNGLNDETKAIVQKGIDEGTIIARDFAKQLNDQALEKIKENGKTEIYVLSEEEIAAFKKALEPVYNEYKEKIGVDIIEDAESR